MEELKPLSYYIRHFRNRCKRMFGQDFVDANEEIIKLTAKNERALDRFDAELEEEKLTVYSVGSQGQAKEDINPKVKFRNDVAKLYADNLEALQLTARSRYKKAESSGDQKEDKMIDFLNSLNK